MTWRLILTVWWMNFATQLASWMLPCGNPDSKGTSRRPGVRLLSRQGSIVPIFPDAPLSRLPSLAFPLMSTEKRSTMWFLLPNTRPMLDRPGSHGAENGAAPQMWFTLSFQEPLLAQRPEDRL